MKNYIQSIKRIIKLVLAYSLYYSGILLLGVLGIFRPKTTKNAVAPAIRSLPNGITFSEVHIYTDFG